jgi:thioester reductase-like protein
VTIAQAQDAAADDGQYRFPLSYPQLRLWFLEQLAPGDPAYHMPIALHLTGPLDQDALDRAFQAITDRHEMLRTAFNVRDEGEPSQVVRESLNVVTTIADFSGLADPRGAVDRAARDVVRQPFDLRVAPLLRIMLARLSPDEHMLIIAAHHIACDGWSVGVLAAELSELYRAALTGLPPRLPELAVHYGDFAVWQREFLAGESLDRALAYWEKALAGAPRALDLPADRSRLLVTATGAAHTRRLATADQVARVDRLAADHGVSRFMVMLAAYAAALGAASGMSDIVIGIPTAGRPRPEVHPLIGCFIDMLPLRVDLTGNPTAAELLARARTAGLGAFAHQELPFERLVEHLQPERDLPRTPLFQVMLTFQDTPEVALSLPGLAIAAPGIEQAAAKYEMTLNVEQPGGGLLLDLEFNRDLFDLSTADRVLDGVVAAAGWLASPGVRRLAEAGLPALPPRPAGSGLVRGYRTSPQEIRACLLRHPAVADCVVTSSGGVFAAYVVASRTWPDAAGRLAELLRAGLPGYLVPEATIEVGRIPLAPDGDIDLAALPEPTAARKPAPVSRGEPADDLEARVLECFRAALREPALEMSDDYFDQGGNSLMALRLVAQLERELEAELTMRQFFRAPTPQGVVAALRGQAAGDITTMLRQDERLAADIVPAAPHRLAWRPPHLLLTGATGFLGRALLERLTGDPEVRVTCLVRAWTDGEAAARLRQASLRLGYDAEPGSRVRVIAGDIRLPRLGLTADRYAALAADVAAVYHCAAEVSFATAYTALRAANVAGTEEVIRFAATGAGKALHYVSTLGQAGTAGGTLRERLESATAGVLSGYVASKRVAEALVAAAGERGLPVTITRPGLITAHRRTGAMGEHDQLALGLHAALRMGILPDLPDLPLHVMPADEAAEVIAALGARPAAADRVIHLYNPNLARLGDVAELLTGLGHPVQWVPPGEWARVLGDSGLPPAARLLVRLFAESPGRSEPSVEAAAAASVLGREPAFSGLSASYLQRAITFVLTRDNDRGNHANQS